MDASILVQRMLTSLSSSTHVEKTLDSYLKSFGIVKVSKELPIVFDQKYIKQWEALQADRRYLTKDPKESLVLTVLDYLKFMKAQHINPFMSKSTLNPITLRKSLHTTILNEQMQTINTYFRKSGILAYLELSKKVVQLSSDRKTIILNFKFTPLRKADLYKIIQFSLKGSLYHGSRLPPQLTYSDKLPSFESLVANTFSNSWLPTSKLGSFSIFTKLAKGSLAIRVLTPVNTDYVITPKDLQQLVTTWRKL